MRIDEVSNNSNVWQQAFSKNNSLYEEAEELHKRRAIDVKTGARPSRSSNLTPTRSYSYTQEPRPS